MSAAAGAGLDRDALRVLPEGPRLRLHDQTLFAAREKRDRAAALEPDFEALRDHAAAIKAWNLDHLDVLLERFEANAQAAGAQVHWARDAAALREIVAGILRERGVQRVVKSKSMLTEECGLNHHLEAQGIEVTDTDLGERIVQLAGEPPSHIIYPAIHRSAADVGELFERHLDAPVGERDPARLTELARAHLRRRFLDAQAGITGANFAVAATGGVTVCTNEGNADLGTSLPPLHIACLGIEKVVADLDDLAVLLRLLARSATGQAITAYTSLMTGPRAGGEMHIVLVDNGRAELLASDAHRRALACIRCGACLNTCPVYRRAGGHAYRQTIPGPIGSVLGPAIGGGAHANALPFASSLCGSCTAACPVRIDLHEQLLAWRSEKAPAGALHATLYRVGAEVLARPRLYRAATRVARLLWPVLKRRWPGNPATPWLRARELPVHPGPSFRELWRERSAAGSPARSTTRSAAPSGDAVGEEADHD